MGVSVVLGPLSLPAWAEEVECADGTRAETGENHRADAETVSGSVRLVQGC